MRFLLLPIAHSPCTNAVVCRWLIVELQHMSWFNRSCYLNSVGRQRYEDILNAVHNIVHEQKKKRRTKMTSFWKIDSLFLYLTYCVWYQFHIYQVFKKLSNRLQFGNASVISIFDLALFLNTLFFRKMSQCQSESLNSSVSEAANSCAQFLKTNGWIPSGPTLFLTLIEISSST